MKAKPKIVFKCPECGKTFKRKNYFKSLPTKYGHFCSSSCRSKFVTKTHPLFKRKRIKTACAFCKKTIFNVKSRIDRAINNFCSRSCEMKYHLKIRWKDGPQFGKVVCAYCGNNFLLHEWEINERKKRQQQRFFCNRTCFGKWKAANWCLENNPSWKGGWTPHGKGWSIACRNIRKEQNYICFDCRKSEKEIGKKLDVHHIIAARLFKSKIESCNRSNLVGLCHSCHMKREKKSPDEKTPHPQYCFSMCQDNILPKSQPSFAEQIIRADAFSPRSIPC